MYSLNIDIQTFLAKQWQKKPIVYSNAFSDFTDLLSPEELAGLACEPDISSRVVVTEKAPREGKEAWQVIHGPFEDYSKFGDAHWQLLVQAVNHWHPDSRQLVEAFRFLPDWRFDDLMISFATPNGGVGPHIDNYDVFIIQGEGRRRWTVGDRGEYQTRDNDPNSPLIEDFKPIIDVVLESGDILYIPPGFPHRGETLTTAMSYSIGFRAPSQQELFSQIADYCIDMNQGQTRFISNSEGSAPASVSQEQQQGIMDLVTQLANNPSQYQTMLGKLLSQNRFELDICPDEPLDVNELIEALEDGAELHRLGGVKVLQLENDAEQRIFINGEQYPTLGISNEQIDLLCQTLSMSNQQARTICQNETASALMRELINQGLFYLAEA